MSLNKNIGSKLNNPKTAEVSLDSLLCILSSAYGTEGLDSNIVLEEDTVNLSKLSIENIKAYSEARKKSEEDELINQEEDVPEEIEKLSAATSTTFLKQTRSLEDEEDFTLLSIKSAENLKCTVYEPNDNKSELLIENDNTDEIDPEEKTCETDSVDMEQWQTICGFFVDDMNKKVIFDIQFSKKYKTNELDVGESDIKINVVDSAKQVKSTIAVPKNYLVSQSEYFDKVDKEFGLENLNTMVKCNLCAFQWLVQWFTADISMCKPSLNGSNLHLILSLAYHLGVYKLVEECLDFFSADLEMVLKTNSDVEHVFDDNLLSKLVLRFSNNEIENISNDFVIFKERLFCSLITRLADKKPSSSLGHYASLGNLFQCMFCEKLLTMKLHRSLPCRSDCNQFSIKGELIYMHEVSPSWNLSRYIELIYEEMRSWRMVYWRLWGLCHFLSCELCHTSYPLSQADWCAYHPDGVDYFPMNKRVCYPIGTYKCCGQISFLYNVLENNSGCSFRAHKPQLDSKNKVHTFKVYETHKSLISYHPPQRSDVKKFYKLSKRSFDNEASQSAVPPMWWQGFQIGPKEKKDYSLIPMHLLDRLRNKSPQKANELIHKPLTYETEVHLGLTPTCLNSVQQLPAANCAKPRPKKVSPSNSSKVNSKKKKSFGCLYLPEETLWQKEESNKNNQDTQRDFEEMAMRRLVRMLTPEEQAKNRGVCQTEPLAGTYLRLEADFWHEYYKRNKHPAGVAKQSTVINRTFPLSWFRRQTL